MWGHSIEQPENAGFHVVTEFRVLFLKFLTGAAYPPSGGFCLKKALGHGAIHVARIKHGNELPVLRHGGGNPHFNLRPVNLANPPAWFRDHYRTQQTIDVHNARLVAGQATGGCPKLVIDGVYTAVSPDQLGGQEFTVADVFKPVER